MESAIKNLLALSKQYKGIIELIPFLEEISSLENYKSEVTSQIAVLEKQKAEVTDSFEARQKFYEDELKGLAEEIEKANDQIVSVKKNNAAVAKSLVENAELKVKQILASVDEKKALIESQISEKQDSLKELTKEYTSTFEKTKALKDQLIALKSKLDI